MTCEPTSEVGLSKMGFMSTCGSTPADCACIAWARPISWPSRVANELSAIFWALNGATSKPSCLKIRHSAAAVSDLPAWEAVPRTINARAFIVHLDFSERGVEDHFTGDANLVCGNTPLEEIRQL